MVISGMSANAMSGPAGQGPLAGLPAPRCPHLEHISSVEQLLPYIESAARRPYTSGLHVGWDLHEGERVLLFADSWYDPMCVEAVVKVLEKIGCRYDVKTQDMGPIPTLNGHNEAEMWLDTGNFPGLQRLGSDQDIPAPSVTKALNSWMAQWREIERAGTHDKLLWGFGGPVLSDARVKIARMPFVTPEMVATPAHTLPFEILQALDDWTWEKVCSARRVRITDPEGTDLTYTNRDEYYNASRTEYREDWLDSWVSTNKGMWRTYLPGHVWGKPWFLTAQEDGNGVIAGTMNHVGPYPRMTATVENGKITEISGGGLFGDKLRQIMDETKDIQFPRYPGKGMLYWWEASIGTNPKIHRPRKEYLKGWACGIYERMRSGVIHIGFGTVSQTDQQREAFQQGLPIGHFHAHLYFPTMTAEMADGSQEVLIEGGRLKALDDPRVREIAAKYGDPDQLLAEDWVPAVPGLNMDGDYFRDYAQDPTDWTLTELHVCEKWHPLYMKMVAPS